ncbi:MAG: hypothetical protein LBC67_01715 [Spirochaetales bacterium]|jgi:hypothetical protein|nr:hypothetical protein [Spirochaetales bacterium]
MRRFVIFLTLLFALFAFINAIDASTHPDAEESLLRGSTAPEDKKE